MEKQDTVIQEQNYRRLELFLVALRDIILGEQLFPGSMTL